MYLLVAGVRDEYLHHDLHRASAEYPVLKSARKSASLFRGSPTIEPSHCHPHSPSLTTRTKAQLTSKTSASDASGGRRRNLSFYGMFYGELILVIFSYLSAGVLCTVNPTSKGWARPSQDNQMHPERDIGKLRED